MSPSLRLRRLISRQGKVEEAAARAQKRIIAAARREIMAELAMSISANRRVQLTSVLAAITRYVEEGKRAAEQAAGVQLRQGWSVGLEMADAGLGGAPRSFFGVSEQLLQAMVETTHDSVRAVWSELGTKLKGTVRRAVLGIDDPLKAMASVAKVIRDPKSFGTAANRAETIVRTEVNRTFSAAQQKRLEQATAAGVKAKKWWLSAEDHRVRPDHVAAAKRYSKAGAIPVDQPYIVGGARMMYPLDPSGPPEQTINCRCVSVAAVEG